MGEKTTRRKTTGVVRDVFDVKRPADGETKSGPLNSTFVSPVKGAINKFSTEQALPAGTVFAVRDRRAGRVDRSDLRLGHDAGWREGCSLARARVVRRAAAVAPADLSNRSHDKPRKASTNIGSSTAVNDRGTHQTLTRYVRRAGGVDMGLRERVRDNAASRVCASWSETQSGMR